MEVLCESIGPAGTFSREAEVRNTLREQRHEESGFTLIELMVVVLIMGILMAIAIPTFLSTQGSANDASAKSNATNVYTGERAYYEDNLDFIDASSTQNGVILDHQLPWGAQGAATKGFVTAQVGTQANTAAFSEVAATPWTGNNVLVEDLSKSGNCFYIADDESVSPPVLAYAESTGGACLANASVAFPASSPLASQGNAGAHMVASGGTLVKTLGTAAQTWFASW